MFGSFQCATEAISPSMPEAVAGFELHDKRVAYVMQSASATTDVAIWETTLLGYDIRLDEVHLSVAALEMVPCDTGSDAAGLWDVLTPSPARATHPDLQDVSKVEPRVAVDLLSNADGALAEADTTQGPYCWVHLLATPIDDSVLNGASVVVRGQWRHPDGRGGVFDGRVPLTYGRSLPLMPGVGVADGMPEVRLVMHPVAAFDALDPSALDDAELAWEFLKQLIETATPTFHLGSR